MTPKDEFFEFLKLKQLSESTLYNYMLIYFKFENKGYELSEKSIRKFMTYNKGNIVRSFLKNLLEFHDRRDINIPKVTGKKRVQVPQIISEDEAHKLSAGLYDLDVKYGIIFDLTFFCGLRRAEVMGIKAGNIDWISWKEKGRAGRVKIFGKGNRERMAIIPAHMMNILFEYCSDLTPENKLFKISARRWHQVLREESLKTLKKAIKPHDLRRSAGTIWYEKSKDVVSVKNRLGHSSISTTQRYITPDTEKELEVWEKEAS